MGDLVLSSPWPPASYLRRRHTLPLLHTAARDASNTTSSRWG